MDAFAQLNEKDLSASPVNPSETLKELYKDLYLYNTLSGKKEKFVPLNGNRVSMYVCGPTAFETDGPSLHYVRKEIFFDVLRSYLKELGYTLHSAMNITDYNVSIVERADKLKMTPSEVIEKSVRKYFEDMRHLKIDDYDEYPRATEHVNRIMSLVKKLLEDGFAYKTENAIYLDVSAIEEKNRYAYGTLSGKIKRAENVKQQEDLRGAAEKADSRDFLLWKFEDVNSDEISHEDLWFDALELGDGRKGGPGWHSECVAMINDIFEEKIDIHGGRVDHIEIHHENENIQNIAAYNRDLAKYWVHTGLVTYESKDGWNVTLRELIKENGNDPSVIRYAFLRNNYKGNWSLNKNSFVEARKKVSKIREMVSKVEKLQKNAGIKEEDSYVKSLVEKANYEFIDNMNNDLNTTHIIYSINDLTKKLRKSGILERLGKEDLNKILKYYERVNRILKIF